MTRIEILKEQVTKLQAEYEKDMCTIKDSITKVANELFPMIDLKNSIFTDDVICRMIYNQVKKQYGGIMNRPGATYKKIKTLKTIIRVLESKQEGNITVNLDYYNNTTYQKAKAIENCITTLYLSKEKFSIYAAGITDYTNKLVWAEREKLKL